MNKATNPRIPRFDALTALRGLAAWWVVLFHFKRFLAPHLPAAIMQVIGHGELAVDVFFCLSGFVIYLSYQQVDLRDQPGIWRFYLKRFARIYPLHLVILVAYVGLVGVLFFGARSPLDSRYSAGAFLANLVLVQDWGILSELTWNIPAWSISAEMAAYLLFPVLLYCLALDRASTLRIGLTMLGLVALIAAVFVPFNSELGRGVATVGTLRCILEFAAGMLTGELFLRNQGTKWNGLAFTAILCGLGGFALCLWRGLPSANCIPLSACLAILGIAGLHGHEWRGAGRWFVVAGEISYSTYMCHYFILDSFKLLLVREDGIASTAKLIGAFAAVAVSSFIAYYWIERPAQTWLLETFEPGRRSPLITVVGA